MKTQHEKLMEDPEFRRLMAAESLVAETAETIARLMDQKKVSKADLARRMGKSRAWVTQLLSGRTNMTVRTLAEVVHALDGVVQLQARAYGEAYKRFRSYRPGSVAGAAERLTREGAHERR